MLKDTQEDDAADAEEREFTKAYDEGTGVINRLMFLKEVFNALGSPNNDAPTFSTYAMSGFSEILGDIVDKTMKVTDDMHKAFWGQIHV
jgi:hypothetical protein